MTYQTAPAPRCYSHRDDATRDRKCNTCARLNMEHRIASRLIRDAIADGCLVNVYNGEDFSIRHSATPVFAIRELMQTDEDRIDLLRVIDGKPKRIGWVHLVYGNTGYDVISDYSANDATEALVAGATALADELEAKAA